MNDFYLQSGNPEIITESASINSGDDEDHVTNLVSEADINCFVEGLPTSSISLSSDVAVIFLHSLHISFFKMKPIIMYHYCYR